MALAPGSLFRNATLCSWLFRIGVHNKQKFAVIEVE